MASDVIVEEEYADRSAFGTGIGQAEAQHQISKETHL
jgi:hypothetical protein